MKTQALLLTLIMLVGCSKDLSEHERLLTPRIIDKPAQRMLVYELVGDPNEVGGEAFGALFSTFFKLKRQHDMDMKAPIGRWPKALETPKHEWLGIYGLEVSNSVLEIPAEIQEKYPKLKVETWEYGKVGEILHIGSYTNEPPTVDKLHEYINNSGYEISGLHEEEYLKGPGMFGKGNPDKYYTIIRYPVSKKPAPGGDIEESETMEVSKESVE